MSDTIRPPTPEEKRQMSETAVDLEKQVMAALQAWASSIYSIGFAAGIERALSSAGPDGLILPKRPAIVIP